MKGNEAQHFGQGDRKHCQTSLSSFAACGYRCGHNAVFQRTAGAPAADAVLSTKANEYQWFSEVAASRRRGSGVRNQRGKSVFRSPMPTTSRLHTLFTGATQRPLQMRPAEYHSVPSPIWENCERPPSKGQPSARSKEARVEMNTLRSRLWPTSGLIAHDNHGVSSDSFVRNAFIRSTWGKLTSDE